MTEEQPAPERPTPTEPTPAAGPTRAEPAPPAREAQDPLRGSRTSGFWAATVGLAVLLLLLIVFIAQNTESVNIEFFGWDGSAPLAVAILVAVLVGLLLAVVAGSLRILQLRRRIKRG